jgi:hypothetical protein
MRPRGRLLREFESHRFRHYSFLYLNFGGCYVIAKRKTSVKQLSRKFIRMCGVYRIFSRHWTDSLDFSDEAMIELYNCETYGGKCSGKNGFGVGKSYLSLSVSMWKEDIALGLLRKYELYDDGLFPEWWLDSVFKQ